MAAARMQLFCLAVLSEQTILLAQSPVYSANSATKIQVACTKKSATCLLQVFSTFHTTKNKVRLKMSNHKRPEIQEYRKNYSASLDKIQPENAINKGCIKHNAKNNL